MEKSKTRDIAILLSRVRILEIDEYREDDTEEEHESMDYIFNAIVDQLSVLCSSNKREFKNIALNGYYENGQLKVKGKNI